MAVKKHKCTNCKKYFDAESMIVVPVGKFHNQECLIEYGTKKTDSVIKKAKQAKKKQHAKEKRAFQRKDIDIRKDAAKRECHKYILVRDVEVPRSKGEMPMCICCYPPRPLISGINAGHFHESGNNPLIRYDEDNIHAQSVHCNLYKGGDSGDYRPNLIKKIGEERVERLDDLKGGSLKRTCDDYLEIEKYYKAKRKELEKQIEAD